jgi:hypothetical protein
MTDQETMSTSSNPSFASENFEKPEVEVKNPKFHRVLLSNAARTGIFNYLTLRELGNCFCLGKELGAKISRTGLSKLINLRVSFLDFKSS